MKRHWLAFTTSMLIILPASAYADEEQKDTEADVEERACFDPRRVRGFDGLTNEYVYISVRRDENYLLTMRSRCFGLDDAYGIGFEDPIGRICSGRVGGKIVYRGVGNRLERCVIDTVVRVENKDEARAIIREAEEYEKAEKAAARKKDD